MNFFTGGGHSGGMNPFTMFKQFDRNGDGKITEEDFIQAIHGLGLGSVGDSAIRRAFRQLDRNGNGKLDMSEALSAFEAIQGLMSRGGGGGGHGGHF